MHRAYAEPADIQAERAIIRGDEARHMKNVLRMQPNDTFVAFDGSGMDYECRIVKIALEIEADIVSRKRNLTEPGIRVTLYQAYPKSAKMEDVVQKAVELGAAGIVPFISKRCVKRPESGERLRRVALAAVKQCGRSVLPEVTDVLGFDEALRRMGTHERLVVCWEDERNNSLKEALQGGDTNIGIVIGPEGGFEAQEVDKMISAGGVSATLGPRILRTETAGIAVLAAVFYEKGQMQY